MKNEPEECSSVPGRSGLARPGFDLPPAGTNGTEQMDASSKSLEAGW